MDELQHLLNKVNKVTAYHRHGNKIPLSALDDLSNAQIEYEKAIQVEAKVMQENLRALEQLTAKQALKIDKLKTQLKIAEDKNKRVMRKITCIGAPLNDNLHHYNKEQLKIFFEIEQILSA